MSGCRLGAVVALAVALGALAPATSHAASATVPANFPNTVVVSAADGELNRMSAVESGGRVLVTDAGAPITALAGCDQVAPGTVSCPALAQVVLDVGDLNDLVSVAGVVGADVRGAAGKDRITISGPVGAEAAGGSGADLIVGGDGPDRLSGNEGDDTVRGGPGDDFVSGGTGDNQVFGDGGRDVLSPGGRPDGTNGPGLNQVACGPGLDFVVDPSPTDLLAHDCERIGADDPENFPGRAFPTRTSSGRLSFRIPCLGETEDCSGVIALRDRGGRLLGRGRFVILKRRGGPARVTLNGLGRRLLARRGGVIVRVRASYATGSPDVNLYRVGWSLRLTSARQ